LSEEALREIEKLRLRLSSLKRVEDEARISLGVCLDKWQKLIASEQRRYAFSGGCPSAQARGL